MRVDPEGVSEICWALCATKVSRNALTLASYGNSVIYEVGTTYAITLVFLEWDMIAMSLFSEHLECVHWPLLRLWSIPIYRLGPNGILLELIV